MFATTRSFSLTRRLVDTYLMCGLACVLVCLAVAIPVSFRVPPGTLVAVAAALALLMLLLGGLTLRRTLCVASTIEAQLREVTDDAAGIESLLHPIRKSDPVARGWNAVLQSLDEQRILRSLEERLQATLESSDSQRWETVFNSLSDGVAVTNTGGVVEIANNSLAAILEAPMESVVGAAMESLLCAAKSDDGSPLPQELFSTAGKFSCELRRGAELAAGVWRVTRSPLVDQNGGATGIVWNVREVTQQKLAEEMRNQFVFTATHELRTPLANIRAYAETLSMDTEIDPESQKGFINIINSEASRLARFIDELLDVSQMEAGAITIARHETDIQRLLLEVVDSVQPQIRHKELQFESILPPKFPKLRVDKDKFTAAMVNLLGNAIKYTMTGGQVRLLIETDAAQIHFHIEDTGIGISPEELKRMGEKFFRSSDARIQDIPGSGLGVAFAQEVARLHGGQLTVLSELDKGSRFTLTLPLASGERA